MKKNKILRNIILVLAAIFALGVYYYVTLPAINIHSSGTWGAILVIVAALMLLSALKQIQADRKSPVEGMNTFHFDFKESTLVFKLLGILLIVLIGAYGVGTLLSSPFFNAAKYQRLLTIEEREFTDDIRQVDYKTIPLLDKDSASLLGNRKMGSMVDMVSQFEVVDDYTQINYKGRPVRIATLMYADLIKWFTNRSDGLPAYLLIDMVTQNVELVRLEEGIKYTTVEHFGRNLYRHIRFHYPTYMFAQAVMEINEEGVPYWICPRLVKTIGLFGGVDVKGAVLVNAITGESQYYEEVPPWVDNLYPADLIVAQYDYYGMYHNGFLNSLFGQRDVTVTTDDYNYIAMGDDVWVYTGVTSTGGDQSNIGFILTNQRTKESHFYSCAGATEHSAMDSAEGMLQHLKYRATFPLLLNVGGQPTYFMAMKDNAQLVKKYAMVNVRQYQVVATGDTVAECEQNYLSMLSRNGVVDGSAGLSGTETAEGVIAEIRSAVLDGNTVYFIRLTGDDMFYSVSAVDQPLAVILNAGDRVTVTYHPGQGSILEGVDVALG